MEVAPLQTVGEPEQYIEDARTKPLQQLGSGVWPLSSRGRWPSQVVSAKVGRTTATLLGIDSQKLHEYAYQVKMYAGSKKKQLEKMDHSGC